MTNQVQWGILSTGAIARAFAAAVPKSATGQLAAVASRDKVSAAKFAKEFGIPRAYGSYEALLADDAIQAVYIATPHPFHVEWVIKAAAAGKHILCEKPFGINQAEVMAGIEAARENGVFLMEAFMYRCHPQTAKLVELLRAGTIGDVRVIQATFSFQAGFNPASRLFNNAFAGGGILDVGCYPVSFARLVAGAATGQNFANPLEVKGVGHLGQTGVDEWATAVLKFPGEIIAQVATGILVNQENVARIFGTTGSITLPNPWISNRQAADTGRIIVHRQGSAPEEITIPVTVTSYTLEADLAGRAILAGNVEAPAPAMTWADTLGNLQTLDRWRTSIGLIYDAEKPTAQIPTVHRRPLTVPTPAPMKYGTVAGVTKPVSRIILGTMLEGATIVRPHAHLLFDRFFEQGGTAFDTAWIYSGGESDRALGQWLRNRGVREQAVIIGKGAHTPCCTPAGIQEQLTQSLDRLQTDYLDIYLLHRDNPEIPVGEFVDCLNELKTAGRIHAFGGSNWTLDRVAAANRYAKRKGRTGFTALSNQFSLAEMVAPVWEGCVSVADPASRKWLKKQQIPNFCWSSQARGFFSGRTQPDDLTDPELVRCWYSANNFQRLERVNELAERRGALPINIALAYVLALPLPLFALIGPRTLHELQSALPALELELSPKELRWLNLE